MTIRPALLAVALVASGLAPAAHADMQGDSGRIAALRLLESSADQYSSARGYLWLTNAELTTIKYQWGGQACNGRNLSDQSIDSLNETIALARVEVTPFYKIGGGGVRCLVGYQIQDPKLFLQ